MAHRVLTETTVSISEHKKNPMATVAAGEGMAVAVLNRNEPAFYCVPAKAYEELNGSRGRPGARPHCRCPPGGRPGGLQVSLDLSGCAEAVLIVKRHPLLILRSVFSVA